MKQLLILLLFSSFLTTGFTTEIKEQVNKLPNVIIIYADDMGWGDVGYHGVDNILTPNIDKLAQSGIYFTQGYVSSSICSPSRCGLLTGVYQQRFSSGQNNRDNDPHIALFRKQSQISEILKPAGYYSGIIGKWHLGEDETLRPNKRGWDEFYGFLGGSHSFFKATKKYTKNLDFRPIYRNNEIVDYEGYATEVFTAEAIDFLKRNHPEKTGNPFCLYVAYNAVHFPWEVPDKYIQRVSFIKNQNRRLFAGMVLAMDDGIGQIINALDEEGLSDNTIVIFISDNGSPRGQLGDMSSTGPFRGWKGDCLEGGTRIPYIIKWPGQIEAGSKYDKPVINLDIVPTIASFIGLKNMEKYNFDGENILPYIKGEIDSEKTPHENLFWKRGNDWAIRNGDWKLVVEYQKDNRDPMLFNLSNDIGERNDLAGEFPEKAKELKIIYDKWMNSLPNLK
ncbi:MAG: sulfatase-like hydrolase/transferase [Mariniphaga sp.]|nr:sulfatase-like hydrolase/transferase [Mariniphaga sp.]